MFKKNRWKPLFNIVKNYDGSIETTTDNIADTVASYVYVKESIHLHIQYADGKTLTATRHHVTIIGFLTSENLKYQLSCKGTNGASHDITKYVNAEKIFKIISKKLLKDIDSIQEANKHKAEQEALEFVFGDKT